jgi:Na+/proline symporter
MFCTLVSVYGFNLRVGAELQKYSATFAVELLFIIIMSSAFIIGIGFFLGVFLSNCRKGTALGIFLGLFSGVFVLFSLYIMSFFRINPYYLGGLGFLSGLLLPFIGNNLYSIVFKLEHESLD